MTKVWKSAFFMILVLAACVASASATGTGVLSVSDITGLEYGATADAVITLDNSFDPKAGAIQCQLYYNESLIKALNVTNGSASGYFVASDGFIDPIELSSPIRISCAKEDGIENGLAELGRITFQSVSPESATSELGLVLSVIDDVNEPPGELLATSNVQNGTVTTVAPVPKLLGPGGTLPAGQSEVFPLKVENLTEGNVSSLYFSFNYDPTYVQVTDIAPSSALTESGGYISYAFSSIDFEEEYYAALCAGRTLYEEVTGSLLSGGDGCAVTETEHPLLMTGDGPYAYIDASLYFPAPGADLSSTTSLLDVTFIPTTLSGTSLTTGDFWNGHYYDGSHFSYNQSYFENGSIVSSGGGSAPVYPEFWIHNATVNVGGQVVVPAEVKNLGGSCSLFVNLQCNSTFINVTEVDLNDTASVAGATIDELYLENGQIYLTIGNLSSLTTTAYTPIVDFVVQAYDSMNVTAISSSYHGGSAYKYPRENVTISKGIETITPGFINITAPYKADLRGELLYAPDYVKKYADDSLHFNTTMKVENIGLKTVTENFKIQASMEDNKANITISDPIAPGANITYYINTNILPGHEGTDLDSTKLSDWQERLEITTGGNVGIGSYDIGMQIDVDNDVEEINEENNFVNTTAQITRPDLVPVVEMTQTAGLPDSNVTILTTAEDVIPGTYEFVIGAKNQGHVFAVNTTLRYQKDGVNLTYPVPRLQPGEEWNFTVPGVVITRNTADIQVEVNYNRSEEVETDYSNNLYSQSFTGYPPAKLVLPEVGGSTSETTDVQVQLTNVTGTITSLSIPITFDKTVCFVQSVSTASGISYSYPYPYDRVMLTGSSLSITEDTTLATITLKARSDSGRNSTLSTVPTIAEIKTTGDHYVELEVEPGTYSQQTITDAAVSFWVPSTVSEDQNQTISVSVQNRRSNPVTVDANLTADGTELWSRSDIALESYQTKTYSFSTWKPTAGLPILNATITGDDLVQYNTYSRSVTVRGYELNITDSNKQYWEQYYGYNRSVYVDQYLYAGTYYSANQGFRVNATFRAWYENGTEINLSRADVLSFYRSYPAETRTYGYDSNWNSVMWYYIKAKKIGTYTYSIELEGRERYTYVNGTIEVLEPLLDIKVKNTTAMTTEVTGNVLFPTFTRPSSSSEYVQISFAAGAEGRTLQGLQYLMGYPHGCPEQTMSPAFAALRIKQYYEERGALTDALNLSLKSKARSAIEKMSSPSGYNAQQLPGMSYGDGSGGWAWGTYSRPSMFYTYYPNYVITEFLLDDDQDYWDLDLSGIDLNASADWLIRNQKSGGSWKSYGYISNEVTWTGSITEKLVSEWPYLNSTMQARVNASVANATEWLLDYDYSSYAVSYGEPFSYAVFGLTAARDFGIGNTTEINEKIVELQGRILGKKTSYPPDQYYWSGQWSRYSGTANAVLALNLSGIPSDNETIQGGVRYLIDAYDTNGRWSSTRSSAIVIDSLTQIQPESNIGFTVDAELRRSDDTLVWEKQDITFTNTDFLSEYELNASALSTLYGADSYENGTAFLILSGKSDIGSADPSRLIASVESTEKVPQGLAEATIPEDYIDPIATDFSLNVTIDSPILPNSTQDVAFTVNNDYINSTNQSVMIVEVATGNGVEFTGPANGSDMAYYGDHVYLDHMYNATTGTVYFYPGSDNEGEPSVADGEIKSFYLPLNFTKTGDVTVSARVYPMYDDEWMAVNTGTTYVLGNGTLTLTAVNQTGSPVLADFYINYTLMASGTNQTSVSLIEGNYEVAITNAGQWVNTSVTIEPEMNTEQSAQFVTDRTVPYVSQVVGSTDTVMVLAPTVEETISNTSSNHWNAAIVANISYNSSIVGSGGSAYVSIEIPNVTRECYDGITTWTTSVALTDVVTVAVHNTSGWYLLSEDDYTISGYTLTFLIDTNTVDQTMLRFEGRINGDYARDGIIDVEDVLNALRASVDDNHGTETDRWYCDVSGDGIVEVEDVLKLLRKSVDLLDDNYNPI